MRLTIFGGTSQAGQIVVEQALADGHVVTVYARSPEKLTIQHDTLSIVEGELTDTSAIEQALFLLDTLIMRQQPGAGG